MTGLVVRVVNMAIVHTSACRGQLTYVSTPHYFCLLLSCSFHALCSISYGDGSGFTATMVNDTMAINGLHFYQVVRSSRKALS